jgi:hypothetical protein
MKYYRRKTHIDGVFRRDMEEGWNKIPDLFSVGIHLLDSERWMSICDVMSEAFSYAKDFPLENDANVFGNEILCEAVLDILVLFDMAEMEEQ